MRRHLLLRSLSALARSLRVEALLCLLVAACAPPGPGADAPCANLRTVRVCWDARCPEGVCVAPLAAQAAAARFVCSGEPPVCVQRFPRRPDDGEWECVELEGIVNCRGGERAAGVVAGPRDRGWICRGERPAHCVDLAPDRPDGVGSWRCRFEGAREGARVCERSARPGVGDRCLTGDSGACPADMRCASGVCVPLVAPAPACWIDADCGAGKRCVRGTCA